MIKLLKDINIEKIKEKGTPLVIAGGCFIAVFIAGFGTGQTTNTKKGDSASKRSLSNYTTKAGDTEKIPSTNTANSAECHIKGSKSKIYHMPGGSFYERTNPAACFNSEEEAQLAGYTKSSR